MGYGPVRRVVTVRPVQAPVSRYAEVAARRRFVAPLDSLARLWWPFRNDPLCSRRLPLPTTQFWPLLAVPELSPVCPRRCDRQLGPPRPPCPPPLACAFSLLRPAPDDPSTGCRGPVSSAPYVSCLPLSPLRTAETMWNRHPRPARTVCVSEGPTRPPSIRDRRAESGSTHTLHFPSTPRSALPYHPLPKTDALDAVC